MLKPYIFGTSAFVGDASILTPEELLPQIGNNSGNLLFCHALTQLLHASTDSLRWPSDLGHLPEKTSCLVAPLSNQLDSHQNLEGLSAIFSRSPLPIVGIGLGVRGSADALAPDTIPEDSWAFLKALIDKAPGEAPNIGVRGATTLDAIAHKGWADRCVITGCPSNFIHPSGVLGRHIRRRSANGHQRIAIAAGNPFLPQFKKLEQSLVAMLERNDGIYICQHPRDLVKLSLQDFDSVSRESFELHRSTIKPNMNDDQFMAWMRRHSHVFTHVPEWVSVLKRYDLVVGTRIHGVMAGIQAGIPGLCISVDSRTLELCETMSIPHVNATDYPDGITEREVSQVLDEFNWEEYDQTRMHLATRLNEFLTRNQLPASKLLRGIGEEWREWHGSIQPDPTTTTPSHRQQYSTASRPNRYVQLFTDAKRITQDFQQWNILSYGCSEGFETHDLGTKFFPYAQVVGCDINQIALDIAIRNCAKPSRIKHIFSEPEAVSAHGPYDLVFALSVLCRWPQTKEAKNISTMYPFAEFENTIRQLDSVLKPGGILVIFNANYRFSDTSISKGYTPVKTATVIPEPFVEIFDPSGEPLKMSERDDFFFQKNPILD